MHTNTKLKVKNENVLGNRTSYKLRSHTKGSQRPFRPSQLLEDLAHPLTLILEPSPGEKVQKGERFYPQLIQRA